MAPVPKKKHSKQRSRTRRGAIKLSKPALIRCKSCKGLRRPHIACPSCGEY